MGSAALKSSGITVKLLYLLRDDSLVDVHDPLRQVRTSRIIMFLALELVGFGATMGITQTIGMAPYLTVTIGKGGGG